MAPVVAEAPGWISRSAVIRAGGEDITRLEVTPWKGRGSFELDGEEFSIEPSGFMTIQAQLKKGPTLIARGEQPSFWSRSFLITAAGHSFTLQSRSIHGRKYALLRGPQVIGTVARVGLMGRTLHVDLPEEVPMVLQIFLIYLVLCQARRDAAAGSAGS